MNDTSRQKHTGDNESVSRMIMSVIAGVAALVIIVLIYSSMGNVPADTISVPQSQLYDVTVNGEEFPGVDLAKFSFPPMKRGEKLCYSTCLQGDMEAPVLRLFVSHSSVKVFLDDEFLYEYGQEKQHMYGYGYVSIPLPHDYEGRRLRVEQTVEENTEVRKIRFPSVVNADLYNDGILGAKRLQLIVCVSIIILSITVIVVGLFSIKKNPEIRSLIWMSVAFLGMGSWEFCISNLIELFARNQLALKGYIEYLALYISPLFFTMYFADDLYYNNKRKSRIHFPILVSLEVAFPIIALFLHFTDVIHLPKVLTVGHILIALALVYIMLMSIKQVIRREVIHKEMLAGTVVLVATGLVEFGRYMYFKYVNVQNKDFESIMLIGLYVFALSIIIDFFNTQQKTFRAEARSEALEKIAYEDIMTGLFNRQKINELEEQLLNENRSFGIVNFDLNDLKKANDQYGHAEGDRLLTDFAGLLKSVFSKAGVVARMGGDEFIVVYPDMDKADHEALMRKLKDECEKKNRERDEIKIVYASGFAQKGEELTDDLHTGNEEGRVFQEVYKLADKRMYENKALIKQGKA